MPDTGPTAYIHYTKYFQYIQLIRQTKVYLTKHVKCFVIPWLFRAPQKLEIFVGESPRNPGYAHKMRTNNEDFHYLGPGVKHRYDKSF